MSNSVALEFHMAVHSVVYTARVRKDEVISPNKHPAVDNYTKIHQRVQRQKTDHTDSAQVHQAP